MKTPALSRTVTVILAATAYLLPILVLPGLIQDAAGLPKDAVLALSTALLFGAGLARVFVYGEALAPSTPLLAPILAFAVATALSVVGTPSPGEASNELLAVLALLTAALFASSLAEREQVQNAMLVSSGLVALYGIAQFIGFEPLPWSSHFKPRVFATMGNPVFLGGLLAAVFPLAFSRWLYAGKEETKDLLTLLLAALALALYLTWTRGAYVALAAAIAVQIAVLATDADGRRLLSANKAWLLTAVVLGAIILTLVSSAQVIGKTPVPIADRIRDAFDGKSYSVRFHLVTAEVCLRMTGENPVLGDGVASYPARYPLLRLATRAARSGPEHFFASQERYAHNDHLQRLAETGIVGFGIWIWLLLGGLRYALSLHRRGWTMAVDDPDGNAGYPLGAIGCLTALVTDGFFNFPLHTAPVAWVFMVSLGLLGVGARAPAAVTGLPAAPKPGSRRRILFASSLIVACGAVVVPGIARMLKADRMIMEGDRQVGFNNYEMASMYYGYGVDAAPGNKFLHFRYSVSLLHAGRFEWRGDSLDLAMKNVKRALALGYQDENVYKHLSDLYGRKTAFAKVIPPLEMSNRLNPRLETVANNLSYYLALYTDRAAEAVELGRNAVARAPDDPTYLDTLGFALLKAGKPAEAEKHLRKALKNLPPVPGDPGREAARREIQEHLKLADRGRPRRPNAGPAGVRAPGR